VRIVSYVGEEGPRRGIVDGDHVRDAGTDLEVLAPGPVVGSLGEVHLLAPVPHPGKIVGIGRNYADHARETGSAVPDRPLLFAMWANAVVGPRASIRYPAITRALDYEAELVVVMGRTASQVPVTHALDHVLGYTCGNDVSARDLQYGDSQWVRGKALDTFAPIGPWIVTTDEIPDPQSLRIQGRVNGEVRQDDTTAHMLFGVAELIAFVTEAITLVPGDLLFTGTPAGVGHGTDPKRYLEVGDTVQVEIEGIGTLENRVA
jgi:2-keto-4-pentenoate hydratase/2-oxohepta-3-ene-1,7-dioic acid hydratase in catechol pathway